MKILITGTAGFIGFHLTKQLLERGDEVVGLDNINDYYDVNLKYARLKETGIDKDQITYGQMVQSTTFPQYRFVKMNLDDREAVLNLFKEEQFDKVCNLAAQAGVRYSIENPFAYIDSNIVGFINILEGCRHNGVKHLAYASSSSVYGANREMPFSTDHQVDHPVSLYAATKKSNELMAHTYSHLYGFPTTGLRFFTVYGPWGRPDMAPILFTSAITEGRSIKVFNHGNMKRDFTYIDDIVEGIMRVLDHPPMPNPKTPTQAPYKVYNIGNGAPVDLMEFIQTIENALGKEAIKEMLPMQPGDVPATWADVSDLATDLDYQPNTPIEKGVGEFIKWYKKYNRM